MSQRRAVRAVGPVLVVLASLSYMTMHAGARIHDAPDDLRRVHLVMSDEALILERTWKMVERGDLYHDIAVYPGLYPYAVALVKIASGNADTPTLVVRTRWFSLVTMWIAVLVPFGLLTLVAKDAWIAAIFTALFAIHPETIQWASRVHPDAFLFLFNHGAVACFALAIARDRRFLWAATVLSGLSAGTKLIGCFIMAAIGVHIIWHHRRDPKRLFQEFLLHSLLFGATFALTTPTVLLDMDRTFSGFVVQHARNRHPVDEQPSWWTTFTSAGGLGYAGVATAALGAVLYGWRAVVGRAPKGLSAVLLFGLGYLLFIVLGVRLTLPRYAAPAAWPLLFVGIAMLRPSLYRRAYVPILAALALVAVFVAFDFPRQRELMAHEETRLARLFNPTRLELADKIRGIADRYPNRPILSSPYILVPSPILWRYVWSLDALPVPGEYAAVVLEPCFEGDETYARVRRGELPFVATATIGVYVVYERTDLERPPTVTNVPEPP